MTTKTDEQERATFEDWCGSQALPLARMSDGEYANDDTFTSWCAWQAAIELDRQRGGKP